MGEAKSFYIFDFDDNIVHTGSMTYVYHKQTGEELALPSHEFIKQRQWIGVSGPYKDYAIDIAPLRSFKRFSDSPVDGHFPFLEDLKISVDKEGWRGPSWERFIKAISRKRTMAIITARGHHPDKIAEGLRWLADQKLIPSEPEIHTIYAVTHQSTRDLIRWTGSDLISAMKKQALHHFVEAVYEDFGHKPPHRFGFSDDDPSNIASTRQKFMDLKQRNPHHRFFLYEARPLEVLQEEVLLSQTETR